MTGYTSMMRRHTNAAEIVRLEKAAWQDYVDYLMSKMPIYGKTLLHQTTEVKGDATSHLLFWKWRAIRDRRDGISNARHKRDNIRFRRQV